MDWMFIANVAIVIVALAGAYGAWRWIEAVVVNARFKRSSGEDAAIRDEDSRQAQSAPDQIKARPKPWDRWRHLP